MIGLETLKAGHGMMGKAICAYQTLNAMCDMQNDSLDVKNMIVRLQTVVKFTKDKFYGLLLMKVNKNVNDFGS